MQLQDSPNNAPVSGKTSPLAARAPLKTQLWATILTLGGWYAGFRARSSLIEFHCSQAPAACTPSALNTLDRWGLVPVYNPAADYWSYWSQDLAAVLAMLVFLRASRLSPKEDLRSYWVSRLLLLLQATFLNGAVNEAIRLLIQRPRPFVYLDPIAQGAAHAHYTSFYSGHTSFAALASTCAWLAAERLPNASRRLVLAAGILLTTATGTLRVMAGRHFITDVVFGALAGVLIALSVNRLQQGFRHATRHHSK